MSEDAGFRIAPRFCGPPDSGNGGYVGGRLADRFRNSIGVEGAVRVRLEQPPPLDRLLTPRAGEDSELSLYDGEQRVARAWPTRLELEVPEAPSFEQAAEASRHFRGFCDHVFPGCFVCGPERAEGDGLRIFTGPVSGREMCAAPWVPDASLGDAFVAPEFVWAALDCPGAFSFPQPEGAAVLLGELSASLDSPVRVGERCVVIGWQIEHRGRKHRTGSALFCADGRCAGRAEGTWIEVPRG